jgi:coronin-1B/1C/6
MFRHSRFKHVFGKPFKSDACYQDIRITKTSWDSSFCSVNPKFLAVIIESAGGGSFLVLPLTKAGRVPRNVPLVSGHKAIVLDIQWSPFNDNEIASASEDCTVKVWHIPDEGLKGEENLREPIADLVAHQRRVGLVQWHPCAENVFLSAGADNKVFVWNVSTSSALVEMDFPDMVLSVSFNYNGSLFVCTNKDKKTRIVDARSGETLMEGVCHDGNKPQRCVFIKDKHVVTTGFSRMGERQLALWTVTDMSQPLEVISYDTSNGVLFPFYDTDTGMLYVTAKGDSNVSYYEVIDEAPYFIKLSVFQSSEPLRGFAWMPKRGVDVKVNEIARFYKMHNKGLCEVIPFIVPRKAELFQTDLYPPTASSAPAISAAEWFNGENADPVLMAFMDPYDDKRKISAPQVRNLPRITQPETTNAPENKAQRQEGTTHSLYFTPTDTPEHSFFSPNSSDLILSSSDFKQLLLEVRQLHTRMESLESRLLRLENTQKVKRVHSVNPSVHSTSPNSLNRHPQSNGNTVEERALHNAVDRFLQRTGEEPTEVSTKDNAEWSD